MTSTKASLSNEVTPGFNESDFEDLDLELDDLDDPEDDLSNFDDPGASNHDGKDGFQDGDDSFPEFDDDGDDIDGVWPTHRKVPSGQHRGGIIRPAEEEWNQTDSSGEEDEYEEPLLDKRRHTTQVRCVTVSSFLLLNTSFPP